MRVKDFTIILNLKDILVTNYYMLVHQLFEERLRTNNKSKNLVFTMPWSSHSVAYWRGHGGRGLYSSKIQRKKRISVLEILKLTPTLLKVKREKQPPFRKNCIHATDYYQLSNINT